jgi:hypothetical protein
VVGRQRPNFDPNSTTPLGPALHAASGEIHYDGAKDVEAIVEIRASAPRRRFPRQEALARIIR